MADKASGVPVVDINASDAVDVMRRAIMDIGFFYVSNHGLEEQVPVVLECARRFFALPDDVKKEILYDAQNRGYHPMQHEKLDPSKQKEGGHKEGFYISRDITEADEEHGLPMHGPNQWPREECLPGWRDQMQRYFDGAWELSVKLMALIAQALSLPADFFAAPGRFDHPMPFLKLIHYAPEVSAPEQGVYGAGEHTDYGAITVLATDEHDGLEARINGTWYAVPPLPDTLIVNVGDCLQRWTNNMARSAAHRVLLSAPVHRYSAPFFFDPNYLCDISPIEQCCSESQPPRYERATFGEHLVNMYSSTYDYKMTDQ